MDNLIPLQYGATKLVLVGDPEQLPPTVLSKVHFSILPASLTLLTCVLGLVC